MTQNFPGTASSLTAAEQESIAFAEQYKNKPLVEQPAQVTPSTGPRLSETFVGAESTVVNGTSETRMRRHALDSETYAVDPNGPLMIGGIQFDQASIPHLVASGIFSQADVDAARVVKTSGQRVLPFDEADGAGSNEQSLDNPQNRDEDADTAQHEEVLAAHASALHAVYDNNSAQQVDELIATYTETGEIAPSANVSQETLDTLYEGFKVSFDETVETTGMHSEAVELLASPEEVAALRTAVIYQDHGAMLRIAAVCSDRLYRPEVLEKLAARAERGGFATAIHQGEVMVKLPEDYGGWTSLAQAVRSKLLVA